jgi:putative hydrolase of the HAD superfamily
MSLEDPERMGAREPAVILFDLGGVLWDVGGPEPLGQISRGAIGPEEAQDYWSRSEWLRRLDTGRCTLEELTAGVIDELRLQASSDEFVRHIAALSRGLMPGALSLLASLKSRYLLGCFSNNNELHWRQLCEEADLESIFERRYLSHEIGFRKPAAASFEYVLSDLGVAPGRILYFDDREDCVTAGRRIGWNAHQARGVADVRRILASLGISTPSAAETPSGVA